MRPNIDIPDGIHGRVKEYKKQNDAIDSLDRAYIDLLELGLGQITLIRDEHPPEFKMDHPSTYAATRKHSQELNSGLLFLSGTFKENCYRSITANRQDIDSDALKKILVALEDTSQNRNYPSVMAVFSQVDGDWYVGGAKEIHTQLMDTEARWESQPDWEKHRRENVTIATQPNESTTVFVGGQVSPSSRTGNPTLDNAFLSVITEGMPVTGNRIKQYASQLDFPTPEVATEISMNTTLISQPRDDSHSPLSFGTEAVVQPIQYKTSMKKDPWVSGAVIENPFHRELFERLFRGQSNEWVTDDVITALLDRDELIVQFLDHHPVDDEDVIGYQIERVRLTDVSEAIEGRHGTLYNVTIDVRYVTEENPLATEFSE